MTEEQQSVLFYSRQRRKSLAGIPDLFRTHQIFGDTVMAVADISATTFPELVRGRDITFKTAIQIGDNTDTRSGLIFEFGDNTVGAAIWLEDDAIGFRAGGLGEDGVLATFDNPEQWAANQIIEIVAAVRPGLGIIALWLNGEEQLRNISVNDGFDTWANGSAGSFATGVQGTIPADVVETGAPANFAIVEPLSVYVGQRPRHFGSESVLTLPNLITLWDYKVGLPDVDVYGGASNKTMFDGTTPLVFAENNLATSTSDLTVTSSWKPTTGSTVNSPTLLTFDSGDNKEFLIELDGTEDQDAVVVGATYEGQYRIRKVNDGDTLNITMAYFDTTAGLIAASNVVLATSFQDITLSGIVPESATLARFRIRTGAGSLGGQVEIEQVYFCRTPMVGGARFIPNPTTSSYYGPRVRHHRFDGADWQPVGVLIEEGVEYFPVDSENVNGWLKTKVAISSDATTAPDGNATADGVVANDEEVLHYVRQNFSGFSDDTDYTFSHFAQPGDLNWLQFLINPKGGGQVSKNFDIANAALGGGSALSGIVDLDIWSRPWVTKDIGSGVSGPYMKMYTAEADGDSTFAGDSSTIQNYPWGLSVHEGTFPFSYMPTLSASVVRLADTLTAPVSSIPTWNPLVISGRVKAFTALDSGSQQILFQYDDGSDSNFVRVVRSSVGNVLFVVRVNSVTQCSINLGAVADDTEIEVRFTCKEDDFKASLNGVQGTPDTDGSIPTGLTTRRVGRDFSANFYWNSSIEEIEHWGAFMSDSWLEAA